MSYLDMDRMTHIAATAELRKKASYGGMVCVLVCVALASALLWWARTFTLEIWASGTGQVIPSSQIQVVQNLEGGIVREVLVKAGEEVRKGQVVARIETSQALSTFEEDRLNRIALAARINRLDAETSGTVPTFAGELDDGSPYAAAAIQAERDSFRARQTELRSSIAILEATLDKFRQGADDARVQLKHQMQVASVISEQIDIYGQLAEKQLVSKNELLQARRSRAEADARVADISANVNAAEKEGVETAARIGEIRSKFLAEALAELAEKRALHATIDARLKASRDRLQRQEIRAPVDGVVKRVSITTPGEIIKPGDTIVEFVPSKDELLLETKIRPQDIGFIRKDQVTHVRMTAYDSSIYGTLSGRVERVGADTQMTSDGVPFYPVTVRIDQDAIAPAKHLDIIPGMTADVSIVTGERTILEYVFKPILKLGETAFRER
ncbi:HlyD family type I secretion periplasmic adaptor subunit [Rhizobium sp. C4]|uniref:HlyD family type I secretion periplasmic adaptor subunit n=1 Tax=Rhizobium sp. C4 TaxID=1349800 RepID=UPI001E649EC4|nr:HlyD family type I secretion periplasmic adaptor subunit [Rhizobium sp. C4]MCD2175786.1 HlyD family type I secretion periplasmic adaptor subunit [Rhizobium sp. C4]